MLEPRARQSGGRVRSGEVTALARLARRLQLRDSPAKPRQRGPLAVALALALMIASALFFARVEQTDIELDVVSSGMAFEMPRDQVITRSTAVAALGVSGVRELRIPASRDRSRDSRSAESELHGLALRLTPVLGQRPSASITIAGLGLAEGTRVWLRSAGAPRAYRVSVDGTEVELQVDVRGPISFEGWKAASETRYFDTPAPVLLAGKTMDIDLVLSDKSFLRPQTPVSRVTFFEIERPLWPDHDAVRQVSTILSGTLYLESLDGKARVLRPREPIQFATTSGQFRQIEFMEDAMKVAFVGQVRDLTTGADDNRRSLMPTWLEWLKARHSLSLFWGSAIFLFSLIAAVLRWWGQPI